ncbi:MAG: hypothetical protein ACRD3E_13195 [Terriglobales bacterium]
MRIVVLAVLLGVAPIMGAQQLIPRTTAPLQADSTAAAETPAAAVVHLEVPSGSVLKLALENDVRVKRVGEQVQGKLLEPVYAFNKRVIPAGSELSGRIASIENIHTKTRVLSALNADLSPYRKVSVRFDSVRMLDGRTLALDTEKSTGSIGTLEFVSAPDRTKSRTEEAKNVATKQIADLKAQAKQEWEHTLHEVRDPGKVHRLERYALAELPYRPEYLDRGTAYDVRLTAPLEFGNEVVPAQELTSIGTPPPNGAVVHAMLATPLTSATAKKGETVKAVITQPVEVDGKLYVPEGSVLVGKVLEARAARRLGHNGQLRIAFSQLRPPNGAGEQIEGALEAFAANHDDNLRLDSEGGATVHPPNTRYLTTGLALALAAATSMGDREDRMQGGGADTGPSAASGLSGFKAVGMIAGAVSKSRAVGGALGFYGAGLSVWSHFLSRGRDVVYPQGMSMIIALGEHKK